MESMCPFQTAGWFRHGGLAPIRALTKTRNDACFRQVMKILNLTPGDVVCFRSSFNRSNLRCATAAREPFFFVCTRPVAKLQSCERARSHFTCTCS